MVGGRSFVKNADLIFTVNIFKQYLISNNLLDVNEAQAINCIKDNTQLLFQTSAFCASYSTDNANHCCWCMQKNDEQLAEMDPCLNCGYAVLLSFPLNMIW